MTQPNIPRATALKIVKITLYGREVFQVRERGVWRYGQRRESWLNDSAWPTEVEAIARAKALSFQDRVPVIS